MPGIKTKIELSIGALSCSRSRLHSPPFKSRDPASRANPGQLLTPTKVLRFFHVAHAFLQLLLNPDSLLGARLLVSVATFASLVGLCTLSIASSLVSVAIPPPSAPAGKLPAARCGGDPAIPASVSSLCHHAGSLALRGRVLYGCAAASTPATCLTECLRRKKAREPLWPAARTASAPYRTISCSTSSPSSRRSRPCGPACSPGAGATSGNPPPACASPVARSRR